MTKISKSSGRNSRKFTFMGLFYGVWNKKKHIAIVFFLTLYAYFLISLGYISIRYDENPYVRILLKTAGPKEYFFLSSDTPLYVWGSKGKIDSQVNIRIQKTPEGKIQVNNLVYEAEMIFIYSENNGPIIFDRKKYPGIIQLIVINQQLHAVNFVRLETYIQGVIMAEINPNWPDETILSHIIASRSYAVNRMLNSTPRAWDLSAGTNDQVYKGIKEKNERLRRLVSSTEGLVLEHKGLVVPAYYHSNSGGFTEKSGNVWNIDEEFVKSQKVDFGLSDPNYFWEYSISFYELSRRFASDNYPVEKISSVEVSARNESGRVKRIKFQTAMGEVEVLGTKFRRVVGYPKIKSLIFDLTSDGKTLIVKGKGYGHGVGLCQWCAKEMAEKGMDYESILRYFYNDVNITRLKLLMR